MRDSLARHILHDPASEDELRGMRARAWHELDTAVIRLKDITNDFDKQHVINIANKLYGKRKER